MRRTSILGFCTLALAIAGCGGDASHPDRGAGGDQGEGGAGAGSASPTGATGSSTPGAACLTAADCAADEFCDVGGYACDDAEQWGAVCAQRPAECLERDEGPVCGCDGAVHPSVCAANAAGVDVSVYGVEACPTPSGTFRCGSKYCALGQEYCEEQLEAGFSCLPLPSACVQSPEQTCDTCFAEGLEAGCQDCIDGAGIHVICANL